MLSAGSERRTLLRQVAPV